MSNKRGWFGSLVWLVGLWISGACGMSEAGELTVDGSLVVKTNLVVQGQMNGAVMTTSNLVVSGETVLQNVTIRHLEPQGGLSMGAYTNRATP